MKYLRASTVVLGLLCLMYFITYLDRVNVSSAADGYGTEFGLSRTQIGFVFSAFAYPYLVFQLIGGWVSDRFGARPTLIACGTVWANATLLTGPVCPLREKSTWPLSASHTFAVLSQLPVRMRWPSGLNATLVT